MCNIKITALKFLPPGRMKRKVTTQENTWKTRSNVKNKQFKEIRELLKQQI